MVETRSLENDVLSGRIRGDIITYTEATDKQDDWFSRFNLTVIIVHGNDVALKNRIKRSFERIGKAAEEKCLVIPFLAPNDLQNYSFKDDTLKTLLAGSEIDSPEEWDKIRTAFNLDGYEFPLLLLTNDINGRDFCVIPTSDDKFLNQLDDIAEFSKNDNGGVFRYRKVKELANKLTDNNLIDIESEKPILDILTDIESEHIDKLDIDNEELFEAKRKWRDQIIKDQIRHIIETSQDLIDQGVIDERLFKPIIYALLPKSEVNNNEGSYDNNEYIIDDDYMLGCEEDTNDVKRMFNDLSFRYLNDSTNENYDVARKMMCLCLGQMFEIEVRYSIVQKMRQALGIEMPKFYNKLKDGFGKVEVQCEWKKVSLNYYDGKTHYWKPPTLGEARSAFMKLIKKKSFTNSISKELISEQFLNNWNVLTDYRNDSAHLSGVEDNFEKCWALFNDMWENYMPSMIEIKNELKPPVQQEVQQVV